MKRNLTLAIMFIVIILAVCCLFSCKKATIDPNLDKRKFDIEGFGSYTSYYVNGAKTNYNTSTGLIDVNKGDVIKAVSDTSQSFPTCKIDLYIENGNNSPLDERAGHVDQ